MQKKPMTNEEYISAHQSDDVRRLALASVPEGVDARWCLQQIEGRQLARRKLPLWAQTEGVYYPPHLSMEQCSSEITALYKRRVVEHLLPAVADRQSIADLTGGFGVDFSYLAPFFAKAYYFEQQPELCHIAKHNFPLLGLTGAEVINADTADVAVWARRHYTLLYIDPARRDGVGRKTVAIEDCVPDVTTIQEDLLANSRLVMLKLSPMLDISMALRRLRHVSEIHVVSVKGECRELLLVLSLCGGPQQITCTNLQTANATICCIAQEAWLTHAECTDEIGDFIYEPNASLLKAGVQDFVALRYGLLKLHRDSNLFTGSTLCPSFPGRIFRVTAVSRFAKHNLRQLLADVQQANLTVRNFPATVAELRKRLKLREGGDTYLFATTSANGSHILIRCHKVVKNTDYDTF